MNLRDNLLWMLGIFQRILSWLDAHCQGVVQDAYSKVSWWEKQSELGYLGRFESFPWSQGNISIFMNERHEKLDFTSWKIKENLAKS